MTGGTIDRVHDAVLTWYAAAGRDLPWRHPEATAWEVYVSEIMAQQTPIARILQPWRDWLTRWPTPAALAGASVGDAITQWGRLGYPRRAKNLHAAATLMVERHGGRVPESIEDLLALPGVGGYTAAAVASFAHGIPSPVLDTNVRRVLGRIALGIALPPATVTARERALAAAWLPRDPDRANTWNVAAMELGALVCTARAPRCGACPVASGDCAWRIAGHPADQLARRPAPGYAGTDREARGAVLAVLRAVGGPVPRERLAESVGGAGAIPAERLARILDSLTADGLIVPSGGDYDLPR